MKANELMLGDHVSHFSEKKNCVVTELRGRKVAVSYTDDNGNTKYSELLPEMAFEPIPLTPEILEKNGFEKCRIDEIGYIGWRLNEEFSLELSAVDTLIWNDDVAIHYVHQLQHALGLCKIEKEIKMYGSEVW